VADLVHGRPKGEPGQRRGIFLSDGYINLD
jgi:hypothetical protein